MPVLATKKSIGKINNNPGQIPIACAKRFLTALSRGERNIRIVQFAQKAPPSQFIPEIAQCVSRALGRRRQNLCLGARKGPQVRTSPNGDYQQVIGVDGKPTGDRLDRGGHKGQKDPLARGPHGHRPGVTTADGNPHLPIKQ